MTDKLTAKFIEGLKKYNLSHEDIINNNWHYSGGNKGSHLNYYKLVYKNIEIPSYSSKCICGHDISENCYITDGKTIMVLGNCCIKRFLPKEKSGRTCENCGSPHKNRVCNLCNICKYGKNCNKCGIEKDIKYIKYDLCLKCYCKK